MERSLSMIIIGNYWEIQGEKPNTGYHWFAGPSIPRSFQGNLAAHLNVPAKRRHPRVIISQHATDELNKWKAYEAVKKLKE